MSRPIVFVDLDDTLFQTLRKCPPDEPQAHLTLGAQATNGAHSMMTRRQKAFVDWIVATAETIPVTARSRESYGRVAIPFASHAILSNGAVILDADGTVDPTWAEIMAADLGAYEETLDALLALGRAAAENTALDVRSWIVVEDGLSTYAVFKQNDGEGERLGEVVDALTTGFDLAGWTVHRNGNNLGLLPPVLSKRRAVEFLLGRLRAVEETRPALGFGDSLTDLPFLAACDFLGLPAGSQLARALDGRPAGEGAD
ncbi:hypothetical protein [Salinarimonas ramus]|uniref:Hydroxymethylpyrimidine pyrophosphatase-like HAD family hydrolase n=1 Tax=Salinarimonas ramus TaxID=690164 RepID=A0A917Q3G2_9HYPH|nr:hypothetical protein [Salinarimonas ramus]GGK19905.1 hypothetical protein GCM10011322_03230 [Salinarimonas ramus]